MAYVPVPKDLNAVKTKVLFNLTKRQLVCFGSGAAVGVPLFFLLRQSLSNSAAAICMIVVMLPLREIQAAAAEKAGGVLRSVPHGADPLRSRRTLS